MSDSIKRLTAIFMVTALRNWLYAVQAAENVTQDTVPEDQPLSIPF